MENLFHYNNLMLFLLAVVCLLLTCSGTSAAGSQADELGHGSSSAKIPFYAEHCVHGDKSGNFQLDFVYGMGFYYHDKAYPDWFCGDPFCDESHRQPLGQQTGEIQPEFKFSVKLENSEEELKFEFYKAKGLSFVKPAPQMFMRILTFDDEFFFSPNGKSMNKEKYLQMWNSVKHLNSPMNSSQEEITKAHLPPAVKANPPPPALQIPALKALKPPPGQSSAGKSPSPFASNPAHSSSSSQTPHSFDSSSSGTPLHSDRQSPLLHMVVHSSARSHASTDFDFSPESESNYASECNDRDYGHWEHSDGTRAYPDWFCLDAEKAKEHSEALSNECSEIAITSSRIFWVANGNRNEIYYHYESKEMACIVPTPRKFVAFNGRSNKMYFFGPNGKEIAESEFLKMASHVNTMPIVPYKTPSTGKKTGKSMGNFLSYSSFTGKKKSTPKEHQKTPIHRKEKSLTSSNTPKEEQITESPSNWLDQREFLDMLEYKPSNLDRNLAYHITDKQINEFHEHRPKFNVYVNNGEQSIAPSEQNYEPTEQVTENHYPLSEAQLKSGLNQFLMNERFITAKHWHKKLEEVFNNGKNHLKTLFDKDGKLLTREQIIHNSFNAATGIVNADSTDLIEILVTAHNGEKPTTDEKITEEMIKNGNYESKLPCEELNYTSMEIKGVFKQILKALCENQRDTNFDIDPEQIKEDLALMEHHFAQKNNVDTEIIKIFTTRNYSHLREMFSKDPKLRALIEGTEEKDKAKARFNKVIVAILKDALDGRPKFFAELLHEKLSKLSDRSFTQKLHHADAHKDVQRILATRAQIDLAEIAEVYNAEYGSLFDALELKAYTDIVNEASGLEFTTADDTGSSQN